MGAPPPTKVYVDTRASGAGVTELAAAFAAAGISADVRATYARNGFMGLPWEAVILAPLGAFFTAFSAEAGQDAWKLLKGVVTQTHDLRRSAGAEKGIVYLNDSESHTSVLLPEGLPAEAWQQLLRIALDGESSCTLTWDADRGFWRALS